MPLDSMKDTHSLTYLPLSPGKPGSPASPGGPMFPG